MPCPQARHPSALPSQDTGPPDKPCTLGCAREGDHELPSPQDQKGQPISPTEGYTMPGHPPSLVGKGHTAASSPRNSHSPKAEAGDKPIPRARRDSQGDAPTLGTKEQPRAREPATAGGHLPPPRGWVGPSTRRREGGRTGTYLAQEKPISARVMLCRQAGGLGSHFCVCRASQDQA